MVRVPGRVVRSLTQGVALDRNYFLSTFLPFLVVIHVNVEAVCLAWVNVIPESELFGEVAALALGAVADVSHTLILVSLVSSRRFDGLKRVSGGYSMSGTRANVKP